MGGEKPVQTLRIANSELDELIAQLEREGGLCTRGSRRESRRWRAQTQKVVVLVQDDSGARRSLVMAPRNMSTGGMGLLHGGFLHPGGLCVLVLAIQLRDATQVVRRGLREQLLRLPTRMNRR